MKHYLHLVGKMEVKGKLLGWEISAYIFKYLSLSTLKALCLCKKKYAIQYLRILVDKCTCSIDFWLQGLKSIFSPS